jgi:hypothetical protein
MTWQNSNLFGVMPPRRRKPKRQARAKALRTCITGFYCVACKESVLHAAAQKQLAFAMGEHARLGEACAIRALPPDLVDTILHMTTTKRRQIPAWMGCTFPPKA